MGGREGENTVESKSDFEEIMLRKVESVDCDAIPVEAIGSEAKLRKWLVEQSHKAAAFAVSSILITYPK